MSTQAIIQKLTAELGACLKEFDLAKTVEERMAIQARAAKLQDSLHHYQMRGRKKGSFPK